MPLLDQTRADKLLQLAREHFDPDIKPHEIRALNDSVSSSDLKIPVLGSVLPSIRAALVRWLATDEAVASIIDPKGLRIFGFNVTGRVDLAGCQIAPMLSFVGCVIEEGIDLYCAVSKGILLANSTLKSGIRADGASIGGPLFLSASEIFGEVRLLGATIEGGINCVATKIKVDQGAAIAMDSATVLGNVFLIDGFESRGGIQLPGARISGQLSCVGAKILATGAEALNAERAEFGGGVFLTEGFESSGSIRLKAVRIGGQLSCSGARLDAGSGIALGLDSAEVGDGVFLNAGFKAYGTVRLLGTKIIGQLNLNDAEFSQPGGDAFIAHGAKIEGSVFLRGGFKSSGRLSFHGCLIAGDLAFLGSQASFVDCTNLRLEGDLRWLGIQEPGQTRLDLNGAVLQMLISDRQSWPGSANLLLTGFVYDEMALHAPPTKQDVASGTFQKLPPLTVEDRIQWLMLQPTEPIDRQIDPQPWMQVREVLERNGNQSGAKHVLYRFHKLEARKHRHVSREMRIIFAWLEEAPQRIGWFVALTLLLFSAIFWKAGAKGALAPTEKDAYEAFIAGRPMPAAYPPLNPFIYTVDNALPLAKLGQDDKWAPDQRFPSTGFLTNYWFLMWTRWILVLWGWFQAAVLGAAIVGRFQK